jgi:hypothetical protein
MTSVRLGIFPEHDDVVGLGSDVQTLPRHGCQIVRGHQNRILDPIDPFGAVRADVKAHPAVGELVESGDVRGDELRLRPSLDQIGLVGNAAHCKTSPSRDGLDVSFQHPVRREYPNRSAEGFHFCVRKANEHALIESSFVRHEYGAALSCVMSISRSGRSPHEKSSDERRRHPTLSSVPHCSAKSQSSFGLSKRLSSLRSWAKQPSAQPSDGCQGNTSRRPSSSRPCSLRFSNETESTRARRAPALDRQINKSVASDDLREIGSFGFRGRANFESRGGVESRHARNMPRSGCDSPGVGQPNERYPAGVAPGPRDCISKTPIERLPHYAGEGEC